MGGRGDGNRHKGGEPGLHRDVMYSYSGKMCLRPEELYSSDGSLLYRMYTFRSTCTEAQSQICFDATLPHDHVTMLLVSFIDFLCDFEVLSPGKL